VKDFAVRVHDGHAAGSRWLGLVVAIFRVEPADGIAGTIVELDRVVELGR